MKRALVCAVLAACWRGGQPAAQPTHDRIVDEEFATAPALFNPPVPNVRFRLIADEATSVGKNAVPVGIAITDGIEGNTPVEITATGGGVERTEKTTVAIKQRTRFDSNATATSWVSFPNLPVGEYTVRARILDGLAKYEPQIKLRVVPSALSRAYVVHATGNFGDWTKISRSAVSTMFAGTRVRVTRAVYEHAGKRVTVDVTDDLVRAPDTVRAILAAPASADEQIWLAVPDMMAGTVVIRIRGAEAAPVVEHYQRRFRQQRP